MARHTDPAPSYEELFQTNSSTYVSHGANDGHDCGCSDAGSEQIATSTVAVAPSVLEMGQRPHVHCDTCEKREAYKMRLHQKGHACTMVAVTFMVISISSVVAVSVIWGH